MSKYGRQVHCLHQQKYQKISTELKIFDVVQKYLADRKESLLKDGAKAKKGSSQPYKVVGRPLGLIPKQGIKEEPDQSQHDQSKHDQYQPDQYQPDQSQPNQSHL